MIADSACIIGLGLMGGSMARDLAALGLRVTGYDADAVTLRAALDSGVVSAPLQSDLQTALQHDLVILATPVRQIQDILLQLSQQRGHARLITDAGSTKQSILRVAEAAGLGDRFVGSHPLAGDHRSGWAAGRSGLFHDATVFICPAAPADTRAVTLATQLWEALGARTQRMSATEHDTRVGWISHLPQLVSSALAGLLREHGFTARDLGPGGRDITRLAASDVRMWTDILLTNRTVLEVALAEQSSRLEQLRKALLRDDEEAIRQFLSGGRAFFSADRRDLD